MTIASGVGPDDGKPALISSYQSELGGILASMYIFYRFCNYYKISDGSAKLYCGNK
jgi:hypothetical protein